MRNNVFLIAVMLLFAGVACFAQTPQEIEQQMDEIKMDESFIYGEDYNADKDLAYQSALAELLTSINELRAEAGKEGLSTADLQPIIKELRYTKGDRNVSFLYLPFSQAMSITPRQKITVTTNPPERKLEQNPVSANTPSSVNAQPTHPVQPTRPAQTMQSVQSVQSVQSPSYSSMADELSGQDNWAEIKGMLISYKSRGQIRQTGNCLSFAEVPNDAYAILMDELGGIVAILSPKNSANRINHKTNQQDNETNHTNYKFIVWYK